MQEFAVLAKTRPRGPVVANTGTDHLLRRLRKSCCRCGVVESCRRVYCTSNTGPISNSTPADRRVIIRGEFDDTLGDIQSGPGFFRLDLLPFLCQRTSGNTQISRKEIIILFRVIYPVAAPQVEDHTQVYLRGGPPRCSGHYGWKFRGAERVGECYQAGMNSEKCSWSLSVT
jgi:hypothetical protein